MPEERRNTQRKGPDVADSARSNVDDHLMPGLVRPIVETFLRPRKHFSTRGVSRLKKVSITAVNTALFRDLYEQLDDLRQLVGRRRAMSAVAEPTQELKVMNRGQAA